MKLDINYIKNKLLQSKLFKDSFWAVFGNGLGNALMLSAGILIARFLGKDVYGEYGVVKSTMFYVASFATFGLGFTSTKFIAEYIQEKNEYLKSIIRDSIIITICFSGFIALLLVVFAKYLAIYVNEPSLELAFQALAGIIVFKAITTTQIGLLSGFKSFKKTARNSICSGTFMLIICIPLSYFYGLKGSLISLLLSQVFNALINFLTIHDISKKLTHQINKSFKSELISFSFPIALQESSYTICNWSAIIFLTKYSSTGELGLYSAASQWNAIITMIPSLLNNVVLSHLSGSVNNKDQHTKTVNRMLLVNFLSTAIPFVVVYLIASIIANMYGPTFIDLPAVLQILTLCTIFEACSSVFKSELMAQGRTWQLFSLRCVRDIFIVSGVYLTLRHTEGVNGAISFSIISVIGSILFFSSMFITYRINLKNK